MRTYPRNSPEAAARIVALVLSRDWSFINGLLSPSSRTGTKHQSKALNAPSLNP